MALAIDKRIQMALSHSINTQHTNTLSLSLSLSLFLSLSLSLSINLPIARGLNRSWPGEPAVICLRRPPRSLSPDVFSLPFGLGKGLKECWEGKYFRMTRARGTELVQEARGQVGGQLAMWNSLPQSCESPTPNPKPQTPKPGAESATPALPSGRKVGETRPSLRQTSTHAQATPRLARALACGASSRCGCHACTIDSREAHEQTAEALWGRCGVKHRDKRQAGARH